MVEVTSQMNTKIRLVRCPRCLKVLPELPEIPVYQCGGCGAVLQAKNRKKDTKEAELRSQETNSSKNYEDEYVSDGSNQVPTLPVLESSPESEYKGDVYGNVNQESSPGSDYNGDEYGIEKLPNSTELSGDRTQKLSIEALDTARKDEIKYPLSEAVGKHGNETLNHDSEFPGNKISSDELPNSAELNNSKNEDSLKHRLRKYVKKYEETLTHDSQLRGNGISSDELPNSVEFEYCENEDSSLGEPMKQDKERYLLEQRVRKYVKESEDGCNKRTGDRDYSDELDSSDDLSYQNTETSSLGATNIKGKSQDRSLDQVEEYSQNIGSTMVALDKVETSSMIEDINKDSSIRSKSSVVEGSLTPKKEDLSPLNEGISSENLTPDDMNLEKSQKKVQVYERLSSAETFESLPVMTRYTRRAMSKSPTRIYYGGDASESSYDGLDDQVLDQPSHLYKRKSKAADVSSIHRSRRKDGSRVNKVQNSGLETHREAIARSSQLFNEKGSPSRYMNKVFHSPDATSYTESDKIELLRMVYELENKLNRTHISKRMENRRFYSGDQRSEKHTPRLYEDSYTRRIGWSGPPKISRMAFSGEAAYCRHQMDCSCSHCYPHDCQCSRHSPSHPSHTHHKAFRSHALTPQHYTSSETSSWGERERKRDNEKHKYHAAKRHLRPIAGGAPIIVCHHCSELLQLPMDFLVFKKRFHQLRCNSCNRIQKFSLEKKVHLVPYVANASAPAPPPSEVDDAHSRTLAPTSQSNHLPPATEQDPTLLMPKKNTNNEKTTYREDMKMKSVSTRSRSEYLSSRERFESVGSSSKMSRWGESTSEIQEVPASGSTLHLLMGYSSPRHVLFAAPTDDSEVETRYRHA